MEAEMRAILANAVREPDRSEGLFKTLRDRCAEIGGVDLDIPREQPPPRAADFTE